MKTKQQKQKHASAESFKHKKQSKKATPSPQKTTIRRTKARKRNRSIADSHIILPSGSPAL